MLTGIFEISNDDFSWMDCLDEYEIKKAKYFVNEDCCIGFHACNLSALYDDMTGYVDTLQEEECLPDNELYIVTYYEFEELPCGLLGKVDFGITKQEIIENVKAQKYVEGASYYTFGHMFYETRMMMENQNDL